MVHDVRSILSNIGFIVHLGFIVTFLFPGLLLFWFGCNKIIIFSTSDGVPDPDGTLKLPVRIKIRHYRNVYLNRPEPIVYFIRLLFLYVHRETSALDNELSSESDQFRFLRSVCFTNLKGTVIFDGQALLKQHGLSASSLPFLPLYPHKGERKR